MLAILPDLEGGLDSLLSIHYLACNPPVPPMHQSHSAVQYRETWNRYASELGISLFTHPLRIDVEDLSSPDPPILGCLQMIMLCNTLGLFCSPRSLARSRTLSDSSVYFLNTGSRTASACPILLTARAGSTRSLAGEVGVAGVRAEVSRKYRTLSPEFKK